MLDEAEAAAGLRRLQPAPRLQWRSYPFAFEVGSVPALHRSAVFASFRPKYLLVATPGFIIRRLSVSHVYMLVDNADGDLYLVSEWDRLERESQLERVRLTSYTMERGEYLLLDVAVRNAANLVQGAEFPFRAMVVGEELVEGPY